MRVSPKIWRAVFERDRGICQYCDADLLASLSTYYSATVDHVVQVSVRRDDGLENLKLSCPTCNSLLSRSQDLMSPELRRQKVQERMQEEQAGYKEWVEQMRGVKGKG